jgi:hypothetical protein
MFTLQAGVNHAVSLHLSFRSTHLAWTGPGQGQLEGVTHPPTRPPHPLHTLLTAIFRQTQANRTSLVLILEQFQHDLSYGRSKFCQLTEV